MKEKYDSNTIQKSFLSMFIRNERSYPYQANQANKEKVAV